MRKVLSAPLRGGDCAYYFILYVTFIWKYLIKSILLFRNSVGLERNDRDALSKSTVNTYRRSSGIQQCIVFDSVESSLARVS